MKHKQFSLNNEKSGLEKIATGCRWNTRYGPDRRACDLLAGSPGEHSEQWTARQFSKPWCACARLQGLHVPRRVISSTKITCFQTSVNLLVKPPCMTWLDCYFKPDNFFLFWFTLKNFCGDWGAKTVDTSSNMKQKNDNVCLVLLLSQHDIFMHYVHFLNSCEMTIHSKTCNWSVFTLSIIQRSPLSRFWNICDHFEHDIYNFKGYLLSLKKIS